MDDPRFSKFTTDPKFRPVPRKERKIKIDPRFKSMFNDKRFVDKVSVDKRGRPKSFATKENFEKFYDLDSSSEEESEEEIDSSIIKKIPKSEQKLTEKERKIKEKLRSDKIDFARGEGVLETDSSSDDSSSDSSDDENDAAKIESKFDKWGELDHDADSTDESTKRIAVCNMDWDRVGAKDIFIALSSFCPPGGTVTYVKVYMSDFGKKRQEEEESLGPKELRESSSRPEIDFDNLDDDGEIDAETMEKIRIYQVNRLKYYYAVAEFDSVATSDKVYQECDGIEYELSASRFDLRFIPDEMSFDDDEPKDVCDQMPDPTVYKAKFFTTTALKQGKVNLTWDEPDQNRLATLRKAFDSEDCDDDDIKAYLANSSDSDGEDQEKSLLVDNSNFEDDEALNESEEAVVAKYKSLLHDLQQNAKKSEEESKDMEFSWVPNDATDDASKKKEVEAMTPWEQYLHKKKLKRKEKREKKKSNKEVETGENQLFSDDELPDGVDFDDPFFKNVSKNEKTAIGKKKHKESHQVESRNDDGLDLLCMESDDDKEHFDYKNIVKTEKKKKKKKTLKKQASLKVDTFQINVSDERFSAVFDKAEYNVDPSNPNFKKTKAMQALIDEKQKRRQGEKRMHDGNVSQGKQDSKKLKHSSSTLENLVKSVKSKSKKVNLKQ